MTTKSGTDSYAKVIDHVFRVVHVYIYCAFYNHFLFYLFLFTFSTVFFNDNTTNRFFNVQSNKFKCNVGP